ncbi:hypothetical protein acdb102_49150 [Acidothermaceae bacterium B102]|nr:hypothetical protein acdb102_49150 [Acidothermaceae bacterium B102]
MNVIATAPATASSSTLAPQPKRAKRLIIGLVGSAVLVAGAVTTAVVADNHSPATAPGVSPALQQAGLVRADRLQAGLDARTTVATTPLQQALVTKRDRLQAGLDARTTAGGTVLTQIHAVTGVTTAAQQARTRLYQELRNR